MNDRIPTEQRAELKQAALDAQGACLDLLKRSLDGTHHHVSHKHLHRYLAEFDFRYSTRGESDTVRMRRIVEQADGRRLTYRPLVAAS